jgi:hypothetical protein
MAEDFKLPWFKFFPSDWMGDDKTMMMTSEHKGIMIDLLSFQWVNNYVPKDPKACSAIVRNSNIEAIEFVLNLCFTGSTSNAKCHSKKLKCQQTEQAKRHDTNVANGKKGAKSRYDNDLEGKGGYSEAIGGLKAGHSEAIALKKQIQIQKKKQIKEKNTKKKNSAKAESVSDLFKNKINSKGLSDGRRNFDKRVAEGVDVDILAGCAISYSKHLEVQPTNFKYQMNNFFGDKAYWEDWVDPPSEALKPQENIYLDPEEARIRKALSNITIQEG